MSLVTPKRVIVVTQYIEPYMKKNSCQTTLIKLVEDWKRPLHDQKVRGVLTTDLSYGFTEEDIGLLRLYFSE